VLVRNGTAHHLGRKLVESARLSTDRRRQLWNRKKKERKGTHAWKELKRRAMKLRDRTVRIILGRMHARESVHGTTTSESTSGRLRHLEEDRTGDDGDDDRGSPGNNEVDLVLRLELELTEGERLDLREETGGVDRLLADSLTLVVDDSLTEVLHGVKSQFSKFMMVTRGMREEGGGKKVENGRQEWGRRPKKGKGKRRKERT
jgi:hypothetical protein